MKFWTFSCLVCKLRSFLVTRTVLFRLRVTQVVKQWLLYVHSLIMGVYDGMGVNIWIKKGWKSNNALKTPQIWSVKYTKFDNFSKKHVSMVDLMSRHYLVSRINFLKYFSISLHSIIAVKAYFHNCGLFLVWSSNYGHFGYQDRTPFSYSVQNREWEVFIDQRSASNLVSQYAHTKPS